MSVFQKLEQWVSGNANRTWRIEHCGTTIEIQLQIKIGQKYYTAERCVSYVEVKFAYDEIIALTVDRMIAELAGMGGLNMTCKSAQIINELNREVNKLELESDLLGEMIATFSLEQNRLHWRREFLELIDRWINRYNRIKGD